MSLESAEDLLLSPSSQNGSHREAISVRALRDKRVAVVIVNWNGWRDTIDCLDTLLCQTHRNYVVIVVDNDSGDGSVERIVEWCDDPYRPEGSQSYEGVERISSGHIQRISYDICDRDSVFDLQSRHQIVIIKSGANLGFAGGCNVGAEYIANSDYDYLWFLNSDTIVLQSALSALVEKACRYRLGAMVGSTLLYYRRPEIVQALGGADLYLRDCVIRHRGEGKPRKDRLQESTDSHSLTYIVGASMLVPVSLLSTIGMMQDDYFLYYEEIDWAFRARGRFAQAHALSSVVYHKAGASSKDKVSEFSSRLMFKNKIRFFRRFLPNFMLRLHYQMFKELLRHTARGRWHIANILLQTIGAGAPSPAQPSRRG